ncbi:MAG: FAD binding domain-containing protein, partial [Solirubrobacterales bacterium]|nr:FAD binding domain-containing protein [Solirubrobacterales bacterium]
DAAEDLSAVCAALKATVVIRGPQGERTIGMDGFYIGPFTTAVGADEMLTEVRLPIRAGAGSAHEKVERRAGDFAIAAVSAAVWVEGGVIADAGIALGALGPTTIIATRAEDALKGKPPSEELFARRARSHLRTQLRWRTGGGRSTTSAIWRMSSRSARSGAPPHAPCSRRSTRTWKSRSTSTGNRSPVTSSRARCSSTSSATRRG